MFNWLNKIFPGKAANSDDPKTGFDKALSNTQAHPSGSNTNSGRDFAAERLALDRKILQENQARNIKDIEIARNCNIPEKYITGVRYARDGVKDWKSTSRVFLAQCAADYNRVKSTPINETPEIQGSYGAKDLNSIRGRAKFYELLKGKIDKTFIDIQNCENALTKMKCQFQKTPYPTLLPTILLVMSVAGIIKRELNKTYQTTSY